MLQQNHYTGMAKVLVIRKTDRTIHKVPMANKIALQAYNNRQPAALKWTFEEMDEEQAAKLPFFDTDYVTPADAQGKVKEVTAEKDAALEQLRALQAQEANKDSEIEKLRAEQARLAGKDSEIEKLKAQLATAQKAAGAKEAPAKEGAGK